MCNIVIASLDISDILTGVLRDVANVLPSVSSELPLVFLPSVPTILSIRSSLVSHSDSILVPSF